MVSAASKVSVANVSCAASAQVWPDTTAATVDISVVTPLAHAGIAKHLLAACAALSQKLCAPQIVTLLLAS
jgi:hypothetical protein